MAGTGADGERDAVLETVRRYFGDPEAPWRELLGGPILELSLLAGDTPGREHYVRERVVERAELVELDGDRAVVDLRAVFTWRARRGSWRAEAVSAGPVELEKHSGSWRIVDFESGGMRRRDAIVLGPFALQERGDVALTVIAVDRNAYRSSYVVEVAASAPVELPRAWTRSRRGWASLGVRRLERSGEGAQRFLLESRGRVRPPRQDTLALAARAGSRRVSFHFVVPAELPEELVAQPPRRRPFTRARELGLFAFAAMVVLFVAWTGYWDVLFFLLVLFGLYVYRQRRVSGRIPQRLYEARHVMDAAVVLAGPAALWISPGAVWAIPCLVGTLVFLVLRPLRRVGRRALIGYGAALAWFWFLGAGDAPLSPCRIAHGSPSGIALAFSHAATAGDSRALARYEHGTSTGLPWEALGQSFPSDLGPQPLRRLPGRDLLCRAARGDRHDAVCYRYGPSGSKTPDAVLVTAITCEARSWRVSGWA